MTQPDLARRARPAPIPVTAAGHSCPAPAQPELALAGTSALARELSRRQALARRHVAYAKLDEAFLAAGTAGLTPDEACCRAGLDFLYGRPRVTEMKERGEVFEHPDGTRRRFTWPDGRNIQPAAVLCHVRFWHDPVKALLHHGPVVRCALNGSTFGLPYVKGGKEAPANAGQE
jgi:hypothetical protein